MSYDGGLKRLTNAPVAEPAVTPTIGSQSGAVIDHHDQSITPVSRSAITAVTAAQQVTASAKSINVRMVIPNGLAGPDGLVR